MAAFSFESPSGCLANPGRAASPSITKGAASAYDKWVFMEVILSFDTDHGSACHVRGDDAGIEVPVCTPRIAATVLSFQNFVKTGDDVLFRQVPGLFQIAKEIITLRVDVRG